MRKNQGLFVFGKGLKIKGFADDDSKFNDNDRKFSKRIENIVGNREIDRYEEFLLFTQCFQKICSADT